MSSATNLVKEEKIVLDKADLRLKWVCPSAEAAADMPVLVFLHDSLGCIKLWRDFPERLAQATGCTALIYDRVGYGESSPFLTTHREPNYLEQEAAVLDNLLEQLGVEQALLFGHSDGGSIALIAAAKYPNRISGILTEGAHLFVEEVTLQGIREAVETYNHTDLPRKLQKYHGSKTDAVFHAWTHIWLSDRFRDWDITHLLSAIHCPVLVIQGEADEYGTLAQIHAITSQVKGLAQQLIIPEVGHTPHREAADLVLLHATEFIRKLA